MTTLARPGQKTYWHLLSSRKQPSEYEIGSSNLLYYTDRGFEVATPLARWYETHQQRSRLHCDEWNRFADPRKTTYFRYTEIQSRQEIFVAETLEWIERTNHDRTLVASWLDGLDSILGPILYPWHGMQMISCYLGSMAPEGRIAICAMFSASDEIRRIQHIAFRIRQLEEVRPDFGRSGRERWQNDPRWQPLRRVLERLLVTYDWGESFAALALVLKPALDEVFLKGLGDSARAAADSPLSAILYSLWEDAAWQQEWAAELVRVAVSGREGNRTVLKQWIAHWEAEVRLAVEGLAPLFVSLPGGDARPCISKVEERWSQRDLDAGL
jgi:toluene monooxygenase system protein E